MKRFALVGLVASVLCGCGTDYCWRSSVPENMRTVAVPTFRNDSEISEIGAVASRQVLREFQREGTFKIRRSGDAAIEIQGVIKSASAGASAYDRRGSLRIAAYAYNLTASISVIDKLAGKVLIDNKEYTATTTFTVGQDMTTGMRDASGRVAEDLARQIVDDVLNMKYGKDAGK